MAAKLALLNKLARNLDMLGLTTSRNSDGEIIVDNASNDLTVGYEDASIQSPMGGVSDASAPYLGIGVGNPGKLTITSAIHTGGDMTDIIDSTVAAKVLAVCAATANNIVLSNDDASFTAEIRGNVDLLGMGQ